MILYVPFSMKDEAVRRMERRGTQQIGWTLKDVWYHWSWIPATQARNYDGTPAGFGQDPNKQVLQLVCRRSDGKTRYSNYW